MTTNKNSRFERWAEMDKDILIRIFMTFNVAELIRGAFVCKSWREAASEPCLWEVVDLSKLEIKIFNQQREQSSQMIMNIVNSGSRLCCGSISCLIFHAYSRITSPHLVLVSKRTPNLKRLVLSVRDKFILVNDSEEAAKNWPKLESLTIIGSFSIKFMKAISQHCKNLSELNMLCPFGMDCAENILAYATSLKILSIECNMVHRDVIHHLLKETRKLEEVYVTASYWTYLRSGYLPALSQLDE